MIVRWIREHRDVAQARGTATRPSEIRCTRNGGGRSGRDIGRLAGRGAEGAASAHPPRCEIDGDDIGGVVTSKNGPEAGVWVIAETTELGTRFAKMVVTDDQGRYVIPTCRRRPTACGCGATGWSTRRRSRARAARS